MLVILGFLAALACVLALVNKQSGKSGMKNNQPSLDYSVQEELVGHMMVSQYTERQMHDVLDKHFSRAA